MKHVVIPDGLEPSTPSLKVRCSNQLSYEIMVAGLGLEPRTSAYETDEIATFYASRNIGVPGRIRTYDQLINSQLLYR